RFTDNNGHNALVIGEGSSATVKGNYFYGSFPHAVLIMNREGVPGAEVDISDNIIDQTEGCFFILVEVLEYHTVENSIFYIVNKDWAILK
ncbi:unnamed protein product, partial [marine sediment metagenome]